MEWEVCQPCPEGVSGTLGSADSSGLHTRSAHTKAASDNASVFSDHMTSAMVDHITREFTQNSLSMWPQIVHIARRYFSVNHGYVLRKLLWQLFPIQLSKKKTLDGEISADKDWTIRTINGLEVDVEEPDMYIPMMGFVTFVLLHSIVQGLQEQFRPDDLSKTITYIVAILAVEVSLAKVLLLLLGAISCSLLDLVALLGYKFFHLSVLVLTGLGLGIGKKPDGFLYFLITLCLIGSCATALFQSLRRFARIKSGQAGLIDNSQIFVKALPVLDVLVCWLLLPKWPIVDSVISGIPVMA